MEEKPAYEVGYKKPPKEHRFKSKDERQSPGGAPSTITGWVKKWCAQDEVQATIVTTKDGKQNKVDFSIKNGNGPISGLVALQLVKGAIEGDLAFIREVLDRTEGKAPQTVNLNRNGKTVVRPDEDGNIVIEEVDESETP